MKLNRLSIRAFRALRSIALVAVLIVLATPLRAAADPVTEADGALIRNVIESQIRAFKAGDHVQAYSYAAPVIQRLYPDIDRFIGMVKGGYLPLYDPESFVFGRSTEIGGAVHQEMIVTDEAGKQWQAVYTLQRQEDGSWKITGVKMNPFNGASA